LIVRKCIHFFKFKDFKAVLNFSLPLLAIELLTHLWLSIHKIYKTYPWLKLPPMACIINISW